MSTLSLPVRLLYDRLLTTWKTNIRPKASTEEYQQMANLMSIQLTKFNWAGFTSIFRNIMITGSQDPTRRADSEAELVTIMKTRFNIPQFFPLFQYLPEIINSLVNCLLVDWDKGYRW